MADNIDAATRLANAAADRAAQEAVDAHKAAWRAREAAALDSTNKAKVKAASRALNAASEATKQAQLSWLAANRTPEQFGPDARRAQACARKAKAAREEAESLWRLADDTFGV